VPVAAAACFCLQVNTAALTVIRRTEKDVEGDRMVAERCFTPPVSGEGVVSPRTFPRAEKRAQMLMRVGLGVGRACLPEEDEGLRAPDRALIETRRREKHREAPRGVSITPIRIRIGRRPNGVLENAWRRDADVGMCLPSTYFPGDEFLATAAASAVGAEARRRARESPR